MLIIMLTVLAHVVAWIGAVMTPHVTSLGCCHHHHNYHRFSRHHGLRLLVDSTLEEGWFSLCRFQQWAHIKTCTECMYYVYYKCIYVHTQMRCT